METETGASPNPMKTWKIQGLFKGPIITYKM